jgi:hypothetical protein
MNSKEVKLSCGHLAVIYGYNDHWLFRITECSCKTTHLSISEDVK